MIRVSLVTSNHELVTYGTIPPFQMLPEVILWGVRVFKLYAPHTSPETAAIYVEVFSVYLVNADSSSQEPAAAPAKAWLDGDERRTGRVK